MVYHLKKIYMELTRPKIESRDPKSSSRAHKHAREFLGMIGCFHDAPNSRPTLKSLPAPEFWLVLDLLMALAI